MIKTRTNEIILQRHASGMYPPILLSGITLTGVDPLRRVVHALAPGPSERGFLELDRFGYSHNLKSRIFQTNML